MGKVDKTTRVSDHEPWKPRARATRVVVKYWMANPKAREDAERTSSVSLRQCVRNLQRRTANKSVRT